MVNRKEITEGQILQIGKVLKNENRPLKERFRALFTLRNIGGPVAINCINDVFDDTSVLLKHELAYCLGQMQDVGALTVLKNVLEDKNQEPMVRHEAGEAIGAIGCSESISLLEKYCSDEVPEVAETCQLALERIKWIKSTEKSEVVSSKSESFSSVDPAPPLNIVDVSRLKAVLLDEDETLFKRYQAMFALRNMQTDDAVLALCEGLRAGSALFRHEVAFVLGQLQRPISISALVSSLEDVSENEMVRHECAEALGAIATEECVEILTKYLVDDKRVVKESCEIALDMCEYENSPEFQYANTLGKVEN